MSVAIDQGVATITAAFIALSGIVLGFVLSQITEYFRISREAKIRQKEKIVERRIASHERVLEICEEMTAVVDLSSVLGLSDPTGGFPRGPVVLQSLQVFQSWYTDGFIRRYQSSRVWVSNSTLRELNFAQDYLITLNKYLEKNPPANYYKFSNDIRQDFIDISSRLHKQCVHFLGKDIVKLDFSDLNKWHKYPMKKTQKMLNDTCLAALYLNQAEEAKN